MVIISIRGAGLGALALTFACTATHSGQLAPDSQNPYRATDAPVSAHRPDPHEPAADPDSDAPVSLHGILAYAQIHAPAIRIAQARTLRGPAEIQAAHVRLPSDPSINVSAGPRLAPNGNFGVDVQLSVQQQVEIAGQRRLRIAAAERFDEVTRAESRQAAWQVHQRVHALFHRVLIAREQSAAAQRWLEFTEQLLDIARRRQRAGDISALDITAAEGELAQARQAKIRADSTYRRIRLQLAETAGWPADKLPEPAGVLDKPRAALSTAQLVQMSHERHPGLRTSEARIREATARARLADREAWPSATVGLSYTREAESMGGFSGDSEAHIVLAGFGLSLPLWYQNRPERSRARAALAIARTESDVLRSTLAARVARATEAVNAASQRVAVYGDDIVPTFERNLTLIRKAFELGEIDVLQVLVARERFLEVQRDALGAYQDYFDALAALEAVVGTEISPDDRHDEATAPASTGGAR